MNQGIPATPAADSSSRRKRVGFVGAGSHLHAEVLDTLHRAGIDYEALDYERLQDTEPRPAGRELEAVVVCHSDDAATVVHAVRQTKAALPGCPVVVVWPASSAGDPRKVLRVGADGLVVDADIERELEATVQAVSAGLICVPLRYRAILDAEALSMREKQILGMLVRGFTNAEIAAKLFLAESTVKSHLSSAYAKLGVRSRQAAASMILDPDEGLGPGILAISAA